MDVLPFFSANHLTLLLSGLLFVSVLWFLFVAKKTEYILYGLLVWFAIESVVLKYTPIEYYGLVKYAPEVLLYGVFVGAWIRYMSRSRRVLPKNLLNKWLLLFFGVALVSLTLNAYSVETWALGIRQVLRFVTVYFVVLFFQYERSVVRRMLTVGFLVLLFEAVLAVVQYAVGGALDPYLFSSEVVSVGGSALLGGAEQFWQPGTRVFATLGRYDRLGSLLALGLVVLTPYALKWGQKEKYWWLAFGLLCVALLLTRSRASWLGALLGVFVVGVVILKDRRVAYGMGAGGVLVGVYLLLSLVYGGASAQVVDRSTQTLSDRIFEAVSIASWRESYEGYGRIFFIVNTPRHVIATAPFFGVGPGNFGGGVAASLVNTRVYDRLKLPFGIQNEFGQIDNSWFSIWGEVGTLGLLVFVALFGSLWRMGYSVYPGLFERDRLFVVGFLGVVPAVMVMGFFGPYFEFRALMCYFWMSAGVVALEWNQKKERGNLLR